MKQEVQKCERADFAFLDLFTTKSKKWFTHRKWQQSK